MISLNEFLAAVEEIAAENPSYRKGGSGFDGSCDCIGLIIGALQRCGGKWSGIHGSNWAARNATTGMKRIVSNSDLEIGNLVYKAKTPGEKGYDLEEVLALADRRMYEDKKKIKEQNKAE